MNPFILYIIPVIILLISLTLIYIFFKNRVNNSPPGSLASVKHEIVHCHKCRKEMTPGFVLVSRGILFFELNEKLSPFLSSIQNKVLKNTVNMGMKYLFNKSWRCKECEVVTIDHSSLFSK
ncbi:MAG: PF20097 family protein [bacterium]